MSPTPPKIQEFFKSYEKSIAPEGSVDLETIYHTTFLFAGPNGAQTVKLEDFLKVIPKMTAYSRSKGLVSTSLKSLESVSLDQKYTQVRVVWDVAVQAPDHPTKYLDTLATYVVMDSEAGFRIISQIDHQDLSAML